MQVLSSSSQIILVTLIPRLVKFKDNLPVKFLYFKHSGIYLFSVILSHSYMRHIRLVSMSLFQVQSLSYLFSDFVICQYSHVSFSLFYSFITQIQVRNIFRKPIFVSFMLSCLSSGTYPMHIEGSKTRINILNQIFCYIIIYLYINILYTRQISYHMFRTIIRNLTCLFGEDSSISFRLKTIVLNLGIAPSKYFSAGLL